MLKPQDVMLSVLLHGFRAKQNHSALKQSPWKVPRLIGKDLVSLKIPRLKHLILVHHVTYISLGLQVNSPETVRETTLLFYL